MLDLVSIIIPVYNAEKYLRQCIESLIHQTYKDIEMIFVDDGSTDNSVEILSEYKEIDPRIQVLRQSNMHAGVARNNGMKVAKGKYLFFLDSDDYFELTMVEKCYIAGEKHQAEIVAFEYEMFDDNSLVVLKRTQNKLGKTRLISYEQKGAFFSEFLCVPWNKMFLKSFIEREEIQFQDLLNTNDEFFCRLSMYLAKRIYYMTDLFVHYRNNNNGLHLTRKKDLTCPVRCAIALKSEVKKRELTEESITKNLDDTILQMIGNAVQPGKEVDLSSQKKAYEFLKPRIIPDLYDSIERIPPNSIPLMVFSSNSFEEYLYELTEFWIDAYRKKNDYSDSADYRLGQIILKIPRIIKNFIHGRWY